MGLNGDHNLQIDGAVILSSANMRFRLSSMSCLSLGCFEEDVWFVAPLCER